MENDKLIQVAKAFMGNLSATQADALKKATNETEIKAVFEEKFSQIREQHKAVLLQDKEFLDSIGNDYYKNAEGKYRKEPMEVIKSEFGLSHEEVYDSDGRSKPIREVVQKAKEKFSGNVKGDSKEIVEKYQQQLSDKDKQIEAMKAEMESKVNELQTKFDSTVKKFSLKEAITKRVAAESDLIIPVEDMTDLAMLKLQSYNVKVGDGNAIEFLNSDGMKLRKPDNSGFVEPDEIWNGIFDKYRKPKEEKPEPPNPTRRTITVGDEGDGKPKTRQQRALEKAQKHAESLQGSNT